MNKSNTPTYESDSFSAAMERLAIHGGVQPSHIKKAQDFHDIGTDVAAKEIMKDMEYVRLSFGYSYNTFSQLLGLNRSTYYRSVEYQGNLSLPAFLAFCYIFGYDTSIARKNIREKCGEETDIQRELGATLYALNPYTLSQIRDTIKLSDCDDPRKVTLACDLIDKIIAFKQNNPG